KDEQKFKHYIRRHELPTEVWYKAYPGLTTADLARNARIREGIERTDMSEAEIRDWLRLFLAERAWKRPPAGFPISRGCCASVMVVSRARRSSCCRSPTAQRHGHGLKRRRPR